MGNKYKYVIDDYEEARSLEVHIKEQDAVQDIFGK